MVLFLTLANSSVLAEEVTFLVGIHYMPATPQYEYYVRTDNSDLIRQCRDQLALPEDERFLHINGALDWDDGGFNAPWSWHIVPEDWVLAEISMEVCDGLPEMVEADVWYWITYVGRYCCWLSHIRAELPPTDVAEVASALSEINLFPNPFNPQTIISFRITRVESVRISVYDLTGRRIVVLADRDFEPGRHSVRWDGRDGFGRSVPAGAYLVRLESSRSVATHKVVLAR
jgi:hypothetical protein